MKPVAGARIVLRRRQVHHGNVRRWLSTLVAHGDALMEPVDPPLFAEAPAAKRKAWRSPAAFSIGVPWVLVLVYGVALVVSAMAGMAMALFGW